MSLVTPRIQEIFNRPSPGPHKVVRDLVEYPDFLVIRLYKDNWDTVDASWKQEVVVWLHSILDEINSDGTPITVELYPKVP